MLLQVQNLESLFSESIERLPCQVSTKAYVSNVFTNNVTDYSNQSLTLVYSKAKFEYRFDLFQALADWILFCKTMFPENLSGASDDYYSALAQDSYYRCFKMINKKWLLFEELADQFPVVVNTLQINRNFGGSLQESLLFPSART